MFLLSNRVPLLGEQAVYLTESHPLLLRPDLKLETSYRWGLAILPETSLKSIKNPEHLPWRRVEASTLHPSQIRLPRIPSQLLRSLLPNRDAEVKLRLTTYLTTNFWPESWEIEEFIEQGKIITGPATTSGFHDEGYCIIEEP